MFAFFFTRCVYAINESGNRVIWLMELPGHSLFSSFSWQNLFWNCELGNRNLSYHTLVLIHTGRTCKVQRNVNVTHWISLCLSKGGGGLLIHLLFSGFPRLAKISTSASTRCHLTPDILKRHRTPLPSLHYTFASLQVRIPAQGCVGERWLCCKGSTQSGCPVLG